MAEFHFNSTVKDYMLSGANNALALMCDEYVDRYNEVGGDTKDLDGIVLLNELIQTIEDNQRNTDLNTDEIFQEALSKFYSEFNLLPYQSHIIGGVV